MAKRKFLVTARVQNPKGEWLDKGDEITLEADEKGVPTSRLYHNRVMLAGRGRAEASDGTAEAKQLVKEAEDQAATIVAEAQKRAEEIVNEAQQTAESLVAEALKGKGGK